MVCAVGLIYRRQMPWPWPTIPTWPAPHPRFQGLSQFVFGAIAAPLVGIAGEQTALPLGMVATSVSLCAMTSFVSLVLPVTRCAGTDSMTRHSERGDPPTAQRPPDRSLGPDRCTTGPATSAVQSGTGPGPNHEQICPFFCLRHEHRARISFGKLQLPTWLGKASSGRRRIPLPVRRADFLLRQPAIVIKLRRARRLRSRSASRSHAPRVRVPPVRRACRAAQRNAARGRLEL